jgi:hypothetical protein
VHGVFPSSHKTSASARTIQIHRTYEGDSGEVVIPFMHVGTYPTRNFATLGPSELQPPFTGVLDLRVNVHFSPSSTGQVSVPIHPLSSLQRPVFLVNSRPSLFSDTSKKIISNFFWVLFFPKLQSQFAEFLLHISFARFSLFNLSTCVGLSTVFFCIIYFL